jgi:hypothetical protein
MPGKKKRQLTWALISAWGMFIAPHDADGAAANQT